MFSKMAVVALITAFTLLSRSLTAQKKWAGADKAAWLSPSSWEPTGIPDSMDDIILDNSLLPADYTVLLPDTTVVLQSLTIVPATGKRIEFILPASNKHTNALRLKDTLNAITIRAGGVFRNASGLTSGQSVKINGSLRIENDGRYVHSTRALHATEIVGRLSADTGTERGVFEYDVPGGAYSISVSNRKYGRLILSANASDGKQTYNGSGGNSLTIQSDFEINDGVRFNLDLTRDVYVNGNFIQRGGTFNLASQDDTMAIKIKGDLFQVDSARITETASGLPVLEFSGERSQQVALKGVIADSVALRINNPEGIVLAERLVLPYRLEMVNGKIRTTRAHPLILADNCKVSGASKKSFIEGPVEKIGDDDFEFPVGNGSDYAPVKMIGSGDGQGDVFRAEYFLADPGDVYGNVFENPPIVRLSALEYWTVERRAGTSGKKFEFTVGTNSNATSLEHLVVARWDEQASRWKSEGNAAFSGNATGTIESNTVTGFGAFTLASTVPNQNPLPLALMYFQAEAINGSMLFTWKTADGFEPDYFEIERSADGGTYQSVKKVIALPGIHDYTIECPGIYNENVFFRLKVMEKTGSMIYSPVAFLPGNDQASKSIRMAPSPVIKRAALMFSPGIKGRVRITVTDMTGRTVKISTQELHANTRSIPLNLEDIPAGVYVMQVYDGRNDLRSTTFIKR